MGVGGIFIALNAEINRGADSFSVEGLALLAQQIASAGKAGMALGAGGVVVEMPVMALGKQRDAVDICPLHGAGEFSRIEVPADIGDCGPGVEIKVDLAKPKGLWIAQVIPRLKQVSPGIFPARLWIRN